MTQVMTRSLTRAVVGLQIVGALAIVGLALHLALPDSGSVAWFSDHILYYGIELIAVALVWSRAVTGRNRLAWSAIALGMTAYVAGELLWLGLYSGMESPPYPSFADILYLGFFPPVYIGIALLFRARVRGVGAGLWIDGVALALAAGALASAVLVDAVLDTTEGAPSTVVTNLAYPLGDVFLLALIVGAFSLTGWRPGRSWLFVAAALCVFAFGDSVYLFQTARGTYVEGTLLDLTWPLRALRPGSRKLVRQARSAPDRGSRACAARCAGALRRRRGHRAHPRSLPYVQPLCGAARRGGARGRPRPTVADHP